MRSMPRGLLLVLSAAAMLLTSAGTATAGQPTKGAYSNIQLLGDSLEFVGGQLDIRVLGQSPAFLDLALITNQPANTMLKFLARSSACGGSTRLSTKRFELTQPVSSDGTIFINKPVSLTAGLIRSVTISGPGGVIGCSAMTMYADMPAAAAVRPQAADDGIQDGAMGKLPSGGSHKGRGQVLRLNSTDVQVRASLKGLTAGHDYSIKGVSKVCGTNFSSGDLAFTLTFMNVQTSINVQQTKAVTQAKLVGLRSIRVKDIDSNTGWGCVPLTRFEIVSS